MPAKFHVIGTFTLNAQELFVIYGDIVDGAVSAGMFLGVRLNSAVMIRVPIHSVEFLDGCHSSHVALTFKFDHPEAATGWKLLNIGDEIIEITDHESGIE